MNWSGLMRAALGKAREGYGNTGPNPLVGALVVRDGEVVASGAHRHWGGPHAEAAALMEAGEAARGADLVVTLEPCSHFGRTPPCVQAIEEAGIGRVVVGTLDPNPRERGRGVTQLERAGIDVIVGVEEEKCRRTNEAYFKFITTGTPFVTLKLACSVDGRIATATGDSNWFTSPATDRLIHRLRRDSNALLVGGGTVRSDDPSLTVRKARPLTRPLRVVLSSTLKLERARKLFRDQERLPTVVYTTQKRDQEMESWLEDQGVRVHVVEPGPAGPALPAVLRHLGSLGVARLLVDGGGGIAASLLAGHLIDRLLLAFAPVVVGARGRPSFNYAGVEVLAEASRFDVESVRRSGADVVVTYRLGPEYWCGVPWER